MQNFFADYLRRMTAPSGDDTRGTSTGTAALAMKYKPLYDQAVINGEVDPQQMPYESWLPQQLQKSQPQPPQQPAPKNALSY
jgi:hypothetical protein